MNYHASTYNRLSGITGAIKAMCAAGLMALSKRAQTTGNLHFITMAQYKIYMPALNHLH